MDSEARALLKRIDNRTREMKDALQELFQEGTIMAALSDILENLQSQTSLIEGVGTLIANLREEITKLGLNALDQAKVDEIFAVAEANKAKLADDLLENTPEGNKKP